MGKTHSKEKRSSSTKSPKQSSTGKPKRGSVKNPEGGSATGADKHSNGSVEANNASIDVLSAATVDSTSQQQSAATSPQSEQQQQQQDSTSPKQPASPSLSPNNGSLSNNNNNNNGSLNDNKENGANVVDSASTPDSPSTAGDDDEGPEEIIFSKNKQTVTKDDFELLTVIGKGSFGKVMQVKKKDDNKIYAMKVLRKDAIIARKQVNHTKSEKSILQCISHPFIVNLHFAFQTRDKLYMILDFVNGGELFFHLKREGRFSEARVKLYAAEIVSALAHLHQQEIVYRDLKPENILLDSDGHICITDFGLSKKIETTDGTFTFCGTPEYLAPEVLNGHGHGCAVDWWSLGTLLFEMLTGLPPFYSQNVSMMYQKILNGELKIPSYISPEAKSLLEGLLTREVDKRLGSKGGNEVKNHPWFKNIDWEKLDRKEIEVHFKPKVKSGTDISQIDPLFTQERPLDSVVETTTLADAVSKDNSFEGFTYVADSVLKD
ncbi:protein kinase 2 [Heterostelium album PN500]|uniref:non-specific serine/threonine protein kinase n=1 Tax=Heterostelium pallidum (strain ATCC 26659 / Pp 5 / PN500) TaxID=670386 RepID=D3BIR2_HETP5|nr:protein kinase 2 [Heterostelium album PN500]EFA78686.1 protein kinase 2 [Heterostelium album PN500]|eukprot:XP_020430810.1 protein kinase 2 [Heterostelium album PN500]